MMAPFMETFLFYLFASLTLLPVLFLVCSRNVVNGAMSMIVSLVGVAGLFMTLRAYYLMALQVLVYAGAVVVLFLFVIMLLDIEKAAAKRRFWRLALGTAGFLALATATFLVCGDFPSRQVADVERTTSAAEFGRQLFTTYLLPLQVAGFLLLAAVVGVIMIGKKDLEDEGA